MGGMKEVTDGIWAEFNSLNNEIIKANTAYFCKLQEADKLYGQLSYERKARADLEAENVKLREELAVVKRERDELWEEIESWEFAPVEESEPVDEGDDFEDSDDESRPDYWFRRALDVVTDFGCHCGPSVPASIFAAVSSAYYSLCVLSNILKTESGKAAK